MAFAMHKTSLTLFLMPLMFNFSFYVSESSNASQKAGNFKVNI
ncbi:hypothetical protein SAMN05444412_10849 [Rhodonellum ikkaensis]|uniref:Uncharacterized protein n=1 Tax=Rhodonellum ikkaensis TaxID=336829 RepID=A0A1H3RD40_9BACT|nr:hypothetical protein SAMN05444412_10849 [Rhodonellum ikkaensis]